jgi:hypothetical protein
MFTSLKQKYLSDNKVTFIVTNTIRSFLPVSCRVYVVKERQKIERKERKKEEKKKKKRRRP